MRRHSNLHFLLLLWVLAQVTACTHVSAGELPINTIVEKMASAAVFKVGPEQAKPYFESLGKLGSKGPGKELWVHEVAAPGADDIRWIRVEYQPTEGTTQKWVLLQAKIALPATSPAYPDLYKSLRDQLRKKLGKPEFSDDGQADEKTTVWAMGGERKVILRRGAFDNPYLNKTQNLVLLEAAIAQGEGDDESPGK